MMNSELKNNLEAKLLQASSLLKISLDNHNYKDAGNDEPFINDTDMGNLLWTAIDLVDDALEKIGQLKVSDAKKKLEG